MDPVQLIRGDDQTVRVVTHNTSKAGYQATFTVRTSVNSPKSLVSVTATVGADGSMVFPLSARDTQSLPSSRLVGDVQLVSPEGVVTSVIPWGARSLDPVFPVQVAGDVTWIGAQS